MRYTILSLDISPGFRTHRVRVEVAPPQYLAGKTIVYVAGEEMAEHCVQDSGLPGLKK